MIHVFILNRNILKDKLYDCEANISEICRNNGLMYEICVTASIEALKSRIRSYDCYNNVVFYAVGGDGTLNSLINTVDLKKRTLQYLPYGTDNSSYRTLYNQKFDLKKDILSDNIITADIGKANDEYFFGMLGLGLDAKIDKNMEKFRGVPLPKALKYYTSVFYTLYNDSKPVNMKLTLGTNSVSKDYSLVRITNGFDEKLDIVTVDDIKVLKIPKLFKNNKNDNYLKDSNVKEYVFEKILIEGDIDLLYEIDGEIKSSSKIEVSVLPKVLKLKGKRYNK